MSDGGGSDRGRRRRPRLRTRLLRGTLYSLLVLAIVLGAGWWWLETDAAAERLRGWLEGRASRALDRPVRIATLELDVFPFRVSLDGIVVEGTAGDDAPFLTVEQTDVAVRPWPLVAGRLQIASVELYGPRLHVDLARDGTTNAPRLVRDGAGGG